MDTRHGTRITEEPGSGNCVLGASLACCARSAARSTSLPRLKADMLHVGPQQQARRASIAAARPKPRRNDAMTKDAQPLINRRGLKLLVVNFGATH